MIVLAVAEVDEDEFPAFPDLTMPLRAPDGPFATGFDGASFEDPAAEVEAEADDGVDDEAFEALPMLAAAGFSDFSEPNLLCFVSVRNKRKI